MLIPRWATWGIIGAILLAVEIVFLRVAHQYNGHGEHGGTLGKVMVIMLVMALAAVCALLIIIIARTFFLDETVSFDDFIPQGTICWVAMTCSAVALLFAYIFLNQSVIEAPKTGLSVAIINSGQIIGVTLLAALIWNDTISVRQAVGLLVAIAGIAIVTTQ
jgi:drug/metabolite transporter (DMT)-like permease